MGRWRMDNAKMSCGAHYFALFPCSRTDIHSPMRQVLRDLWARMQGRVGDYAQGEMEAVHCDSQHVLKV